MKDWLCEIRDAMKAFVRTVGELTLFFINIVMYTPRTLVRRPGLVVKQVFNSGTMSMTIILTCGLFVGMVLGLQGFDTLQRFGADINAHNDEGHALLHIIMDPALIPVAVAAGADANLGDYSGRTPLMVHLSEPDGADFVPAFVAAGADLNARDAKGKSVLDYAVDHNDPALTEMLLAAGAKP